MTALAGHLGALCQQVTKSAKHSLRNFLYLPQTRPEDALLALSILHRFHTTLDSFLDGDLSLLVSSIDRKLSFEIPYLLLVGDSDQTKS